MKTTTNRCSFGILVISILFALAGCKSSDAESDKPSTVSIDISALQSQLAVPSSSSSEVADDPDKVSSPEASEAQDVINTLIITPLSFSNHGAPYSPDEPVTEAVLDDIEKDVPNSLQFVQFIQLPTSGSTIELEVPSISEGWQLLAIGSSATIENLNDFQKDENENAGKYFGFTSEYFTSAKDLTEQSPTLTLKRACNQDEPPKGCASYNGDKEPAVTAAVEIQSIKVNGSNVSTSDNYPWVVRSSPDTGINEISKTTAEQRMLEVVSGRSSISVLTVVTTHQLSEQQSTICKNLTPSDPTSDFVTKCSGTQEYSYTY